MSLINSVKHEHLCKILFLAHCIRISEILPCDAILPRLSYEGYIHWLYWNSRTWSSSGVFVIFERRHHVKLYLSIFKDFGSLLKKNSFEQERESIIRVRQAS